MADSDFQFLELSPDAKGVTHFKSRTLPLVQVRGPGGLPIFGSVPSAAINFSILRIPKGQRQDFHVDEANMWVLVLSGFVELEAGDGTKLVFGPGNIGLVNDTAGGGHRTSAVGVDDVVLALIVVP